MSLCSFFFPKSTESKKPFFKFLKLIFNKIEFPTALSDLINTVSAVHNHNTRYASKQNLYRPASRTNNVLEKFAIKTRILGNN